MMEIFDLGGIVVWIIAGLGLLAFGVFLERAFSLHRARIRSEDFLKGIFNILKKNNISEAVTICEETPGPVAYVAKTAILHRASRGDDLRRKIEDAGLAEISRLERRLVAIVTAAQVAPLLGLLGTIIGMAEVVLAVQNQAVIVYSAALLKGVMHALASTAAGLFVAIPSHIAFNLLIVKIDRLVLDMERAGSELLAFFSGNAGTSGDIKENDQRKNSK